MPQIPEGGKLRHALDYLNLEFAQPGAADHLTWEGAWRGEVRGNGFIDGSGLGGAWGSHAGDWVEYGFDRHGENGPVKLIVRARLNTAAGKTTLALSGLANGKLEIVSPEFTNLELAAEAGAEETLRITSEGESPIEIAFLALVPASVESILVEPLAWNPVPERTTGPAPSTLVLKYAQSPYHYGVAWEGNDFEVRQILNSELDQFLRLKTHDHVNETLVGDRRGHFTNVVQRPITLEPKSKRKVWFYVCEGEPQVVSEALARFAEKAGEREALFARAAKKAFTFKPSPSGKKYLFSQSRMAATTLTNAVFPVYTQRQYVRHRCPGKWWDSLYTWDSGFIGLGLVEIDPAQAAECLAQYLTEPGNPHAAFIHHGSFVPMQIHLYQELWNRTQSKAVLDKYYESLKQYYLFYAGHAAGSTTRNLKSNLIRSWDYFYNSGGWDDYAPQVETHRRGLTARVTTAINSAQAIRCARTLALAASHLGRNDDVAFYEKDIADISNDLNQYAWDAEAGYYSYVVHDESGAPGEFLRDANGVNFNRGLDGAYPLAAGMCDASKEEALLARLFDPQQLWSNIGLTAIDQSAPYYRKDGYWNGTVWFAHQWFFWKTMFDLARPDLALSIAERALEVWAREVDESYNCFEHFVIESGRGAGWHQFSALSTPVMTFYAAIHCPGRLTTGFDAWVMEAKFLERNTRLQAFMRLAPRRDNAPRAIMASLNPNFNYAVRWKNQLVESQTPLPGLVVVKLPATGEAGTLEIAPKEMGETKPAPQEENTEGV